MSTSSREYSPDWLRNAQAPTTSILMLSSSSESLPGGSPLSDDDVDDQLPISSVTKKTLQVKSPSKNLSKKRKGLGESGGNKGGRKAAKGKTPEKLTKSQAGTHEPKVPVWTLPSDSEYELSEHETDQHPKEEEDDDYAVESSHKLKSPTKTKLKMEDMEETKGKSSIPKQENDGDLKVLERQTTEKQTGSYISSSRLPLVLADKVQRSKALVECEGESIDLSGDLGSVGRLVVSSGSQDVLLDLKGTIYKMSILPSRTFCVVSFGQSEAKIEAIMDDFIQLKPQSNVYEAETMVEGTLEGFSFDSEDEADKNTNCQTGDENNKGDAQPQTNGRGKAEKSSGAAKRKGKPSTKKAGRKAPAAKKSKAKK